MKDFPQLKSQQEIDRAERAARWAEIAGSIIGAVALFASLWAGWVFAYGAGW